MPKVPVNEPQPFTDDLIHCARCGANHEALVWKPFQRPVVDADGTVWGWWTMCPYNQEPVLLTKIEVEQK